MGVHFTKGVKAREVVVVLVITAVIAELMSDFNTWLALKTYAIMLSATVLLALLALAVLYVISRGAGVSGLKEGTIVTDDRSKKGH